MVECSRSPWFVVVPWGALPECCGRCSGFLDDFEWSGNNGLCVFIQRMVFHNRMIDTVIEKFGKEVWLSKVDEWHFKISVPVTISPQFFAWVFGLGNYVTITAPESVVKQMEDMLEKVRKRYKK